VLDLHGHQSIDSTGLHVILAAEREAAEQGKGFMVPRGPAPVQRVFEIGRLAHKLPLLDIEARGERAVDLFELQDAIRARLAEGDDLDLVESELIERADLDEDHKAALWLFAWSCSQSPTAPISRLVRS
jgi:hypothetical protein